MLSLVRSIESGSHESWEKCPSTRQYGVVAWGNIVAKGLGLSMSWREIGRWKDRVVVVEVVA